MVTSAAREFGRELAIFLAILWLALSLAAWAQVALGLRPLARIHTALDRLRRSPSERLAAEGPAEVQPLIDAINALAEVREADLDRRSEERRGGQAWVRQCGSRWWQCDSKTKK